MKLSFHFISSEMYVYLEVQYPTLSKNANWLCRARTFRHMLWSLASLVPCYLSRMQPVRVYL